MEKVRLGVIGCGYWGPNLIRNFVELTSADLVAVADLREERLNFIQNSYPQVQTTRNYKDLFTMGLDGIVIATPPATHFSFVDEALENGLNVLVEKPLTLESRQAEALIRKAKQCQRWLMVGHTFIFNPAVEALKKMIDSDELGDIYYIDAARLNLGLYQRDLNVMWDLAPHDISILLYLMGQNPVTVSAQGRPCVVNGLHDLIYMNMGFPNGAMAHVHVSWLDPAKIRRLTVVGSKKMVVYNDIDTLGKIKIYDKGVEVPGYTNTYSEFHASYHYGDVVIPNIKMTEPLRQECQHFIDCIMNNTKPKTSGEEGLRVVKILEAAQCSLSDSGHQEVIQW